jgi:hypothetical protein
MIAVHNICACAEQQECASTVGAFGLALSEALVTDERALLVPNEATKRHALEGPVREITVNLARRDETWQDRFPYAKEVQKDRIPLECADVEQKGPRCISHFANVLTCAHATEQILPSLLVTGDAQGYHREPGGSKLTYAIQDSTVPNARSSASCALRTSSQLSIIHRSLIAEKYVESGRPVLRQTSQSNQ